MSTRRRPSSPPTKLRPFPFPLPLPCDLQGASLNGVVVTRVEPPPNPGALRIAAGYTRVRLAAYAHVDLDRVEVYELDRKSSVLSAAERYRLDCTYAGLWAVALAIVRAIEVPASERTPRWPLHAADSGTADRASVGNVNANHIEGA